jgi:hypothetical protein
MRFAGFVVLLAATTAAAERSDPAFLGVGIRDIHGGAGPCRIDSITKGSGAHVAGLRELDVFVAIAGTPVVNCDAVLAEIQRHEPGSFVKIDVTRGGLATTIDATLYSRAEIMRQRFVGQLLPLMTAFRVEDQAEADLFARGKTTIVGWFDQNCVGCERVFSSIARWAREKSSKAAPIVAYAATHGTLGSSMPDALKALRDQQRRLDVPLLVAEHDTYRELAIPDNKRISFMVIDCKGVVQYAVPLKPDADDISAVLEELYAAAELAARRK